MNTLSFDVLINGKRDKLQNFYNQYHESIAPFIFIFFTRAVSSSLHTYYVVSVSHTTQDLVFLWNTTDPLVVNPEVELPQLDISNNYTTDCTIEYSTGNFTCIQIVFNLRRRLGYHLFHTYIPSALIVVMSWIAFWIKPEAIPARVTLGVTSLLTLGKANPYPIRIYPLLAITNRDICDQDKVLPRYTQYGINNSRIAFQYLQ